MSETDGLSSLVETEGRKLSDNRSTETKTKVKKSVSVEHTTTNSDSNPLAISEGEFESESAVVRPTGENKVEIVKDSDMEGAATSKTTKVTKVTTVETTTEEVPTDNPLERFLPEDKKINIANNTVKKKTAKKKVSEKKTVKKKATKKKVSNTTENKTAKKKVAKKKAAKKKATKKKIAKTVRKSTVITSKEGKALERSMLVLAKQINTFADIFSIATTELKKDVESEMIDKLDKILHENSIIAEAILTLLEEIKEDNRLNRNVIKKHIEHQETLQPFSSTLSMQSPEPSSHQDSQDLYASMKNIADDRKQNVEARPVQNNVQQVQATSTTNNINIQNNEIRDIRKDRLELTHKNIRDIFSENPYYKNKGQAAELKGIPKINEIPPVVGNEDPEDGQEN